ncbi:diaminopimelate decarboxylase [Phycisphaerales bacterium AB-hyl4]|uniref:Diaminopimelate decarboxylase n=1 Tax=Natronomicrosphaera hydrolytica TaxID=3242702 RepID=A0ABV4U357_9BACT
MDDFHYRQGQLYAEDVNLDTLADELGTPLYVYSRHTFEQHYDRIAAAFAELDPIICYSIKSCGNVHICKLLAERGAGMDVVSGGEIHRAQLAGADMSKIVYAGVGKSDDEIRMGIEAGIGWFNIESEAEFENIDAIAKQLGKTTRGALRVNPDVADPRTHAKTTTGKKETKFGVDIERARKFFETYGKNEHCRLNAIHLHIGSPIYSPEPYVMAIRKALALIDELRGQGHEIEAIDIGGGYAADYEAGKSPAYDEYAAAIVPLLKGKGLKVILEPGRTIAGNAGLLLTEVQYRKQGGAKQFVIVDTGMHHLLRPAMYDAFHFIWPTRVSREHAPGPRSESMDLPALETVEIVGPICETGDVLAKARSIPPVKRGDRLAIFTAGAYGMAMASNYNAFPRPAEVLVEGDAYRVIRRRETYDDLVAAEMANVGAN